MKVLLVLTVSICWFSFVTANEPPKLECDKVLQIPNFKDICADTFCKCVFKCFENLEVDENQNPIMESDEHYEKCFVANGCTFDHDLKVLGMCYQCIDEPPEEAFKCNERKGKDEL